jgi:hypothetical protein
VPPPTTENLLVLYFRGDADMHDTVERLSLAGHDPVKAENGCLLNRMTCRRRARKPEIVARHRQMEQPA